MRPTLSNSFGLLPLTPRDQPFPEFFNVALQVHCGVLQGALGALKTEEREILTGQVKAGLTGWWLNTIDQVCSR